MNIVKESLKKFKQDFLPKILYDLAKWIGVGFIISIFYFLFNKELNLEEILNQNISLKLYSIICICFIIMFITWIIIKIKFDKERKILEKITYTDSKTGLKSFRLLETFLQEKMNESKKNGRALSVIIIDIDNFRVFNESYTPTIGDKIISEVGRLLLGDTRITDQTFRRYETGDEFVVVSAETTLTQAKIPADRKRKFIANTNFVIDDKVYKITVCCGIAQYKEQTDTVQTLLDRANYAMRNIAKKKPNKNSTESVS